MSVTTSQRLNYDKFVALTGTAALSIEGAALETNQAKTIASTDLTDQQIQLAVTTAAAQFVDYEANRAALQAKADQAVDANNTFLALPAPTAAQTLTQVQRLTRENTGLIKLVLNELNDTGGT